ncbi:MAG: hypothetical protein AAF806_29620 [Bacteroidota bacterium]
MESNFTGILQAASVVTNSWKESLRFYEQGLGYQIIEEGILSKAQKAIFGSQLHRYVLLGHDRASVVRLIETSDEKAQPNRIGARPWDIGLCVMEAGAANVDHAYEHMIRHRFGVISPPQEFSVKGPEPLGYVVMKAFGLYGINGEQFFITQITEREGGTPLWEQRKDINIFPVGNAVISMKDRSAQQFYEQTFALHPSIELPLAQELAAQIMGGPADMSFDMCLMGNGQYKSGMEQHIYGERHPNYDFKAYPCDFTKTGLASVCWAGQNLERAAARIEENGGKVLGTTLLPLRNQAEPSGIVYQGLAGEIIELAS